MSEQPEKFNPNKHLIDMKGRKYLETKWRLVWMRDDHPDWRVGTEIISFEPVVVKATIYDAGGQPVATAHAGALDNGKAVWSGRGIEKAETAAIGRALAHAGYGTQFAGTELDGRDHLAGAPVDSRQQRAPQPQRPPAEQPAITYPPGDLRHKATQEAFVAHWRKEGMSGAEIAAALGVGKWSEWAKGRAAADEAVKLWLLVNTPASKKKAS